MEEATIAEWLVKDGEMVDKDQVILVIETEKVAHEMEAAASGYLVTIAEPGQVHPCGAVIGKLAETKKEYEAVKKGNSTTGEKEVEVGTGEPEQSDASTQEAPAPVKAAAKVAGRIKISPVAKRIASENKVDYAHLAGIGSGPGGRIVKKDIQKLIDSPPVETVTTQASPQLDKAAHQVIDNKRVKEIIPLRGLRKTIADRMAFSSSNAARVTVLAEYEMTEMIALRKYYNDKDSSGVKITFTDLLILIAAKALKAYPILNSSLIEDEIRVWDDVNVGFAVAMKVSEDENGLVVPVVKNADQKGLREISEIRKELTDKARQGTLTPNEMSGGTFTITNTGPIFNEWHLQTPIINYPESVIMGTSIIVEKPVVKDGEIVIGQIMPMSLSFDHRVMDGVPIAQFLAKLAELIKDPKMLIM